MQGGGGGGWGFGLPCPDSDNSGVPSRRLRESVRLGSKGGGGWEV